MISWFIVMVLVFLGLLIIFMFVYPKYYKTKINKNVSSGKPIKIIEPIYLYGGLMFLIIVILGIATLSSVRSLEQNISSLSSKVQGLEFENRDMLEDIWKLNEDLDKALSKDAFIKFIRYEVIDPVEDETDIYNTKLSFTLTENSLGNDVTLFIESNLKTDSFQLQDLKTSQSVDLQLNLNMDYTVYIEVNDGITIVRHDFESFNLYTYLRERFSLYVEFDLDGKDAVTEYYLRNHWESPSEGIPSKGLAIKTVNVVIKNNGELVMDKVYTTPNLSTSGHSTEIYSHVFRHNVGRGYSGVWEVIVTITDNYGIVYSNIPLGG